MSPPGWLTAAAAAGSEESRIGVLAKLLAAEFPRYGFAPCRMHGHVAIAARRHGSPSEPGLFAVVTDDVGEMRRALLEDSG